jgi:hypothetical protein
MSANPSAPDSRFGHLCASSVPWPRPCPERSPARPAPDGPWQRGWPEARAWPTPRVAREVFGILGLMGGEGQTGRRGGLVPTHQRTLSSI